MGLDAWTLGLEEGMRFWANSGLRHILCDTVVHAYDVPHETPSVTQAGQPGAPYRPAASSLPSRPGWAEPRKRGDVQPAQQGASVPRPSPGKSARPKQGAQGTQEGRTPPPVEPNRANQEAQANRPQFVESGDSLAVYPYDTFLQRLRIPSRTIWTYWDLGHDFGAAPQDDRRELFKTILKHLSWPAGSVSFWPLNFELGRELKAQPGQFWRGVREARATTVFCFGERGFKALFPRQDFSLAPMQRDGVVVQPLPGPTAMLAGDKDAKRTVWRMLKAHVFSS